MAILCCSLGTDHHEALECPGGNSPAAGGSPEGARTKGASTIAECFNVTGKADTRSTSGQGEGKRPGPSLNKSHIAAGPR